MSWNIAAYWFMSLGMLKKKFVNR